MQIYKHFLFLTFFHEIYSLIKQPLHLFLLHSIVQKIADKYQNFYHLLFLFFLKNEIYFLNNSYFKAVRNPVWANAEHTRITCDVDFSHVNFEQWTPFCADPSDYMPYSKIIFDE